MKLGEENRKAGKRKAETQDPRAASFPLSRFPLSAFGQRGSVLIVVLWISIGLVSIALYFANSMSYELRASDNRTSGLIAEQAIEGAARYVAAVLSNLATNGAVPENTEFACQAVPLGDAHFWIIGRNPAGASSSDPYFGLVDEGSKLSLNRAGTNALAYLPNMTFEFAEAIADWRNTNGSLTLNYAQFGYQPKYAAFETLEELRLVEGANIDVLVGNDLNRNGILDASEKGTVSFSEVTSGLFDYVTIYTREPNFHSDGTTLTNVNVATELRPLLQTVFGSGRADSIINSIPDNRTFVSVLDFYFTLNQLGLMNASDFARIYNDLTTTTNTYLRGRVNVNTASEAVLVALFMGMGNIDESTAVSAADTLINYREQNPDNINSIAWVVTALGSGHPIVQRLATRDLITTRTFQFTADIAAVGPYGRGYRRVKFIFDISEITPRVLYRQDLSRLGWALGEKARETWIAKNTQ